MSTHILNSALIDQYRAHLLAAERSRATVDKYMRDIRAFCKDLPADCAVTKEYVLRYKEEIVAGYSAGSVNSMLAAINGLLRFAGWENLRVKQLKVQRRAFCEKERELSKREYQRLVEAAAKKNNTRLNLVMQTICATGIRVSELRFITVEALALRHAEVACKGKRRTVLLSKQLCQLLCQYVKQQQIKEGSIFVTRSGAPLNRSNIWSDMKKLAEEAGVAPEKVFPHSLRHLFARTYYNLEKDIAHLADILGHSNINTTRIYVISSALEHEKQLERLQLVI